MARASIICLWRFLYSLLTCRGFLLTYYATSSLACRACRRKHFQIARSVLSLRTWTTGRLVSGCHYVVTFHSYVHGKMNYHISFPSFFSICILISETLFGPRPQERVNKATFLDYMKRHPDLLTPARKAQVIVDCIKAVGCTFLFIREVLIFLPIFSSSFICSFTHIIILATIICQLLERFKLSLLARYQTSTTKEKEQ